jgi:hypothetical protein
MRTKVVTGSLFLVFAMVIQTQHANAQGEPTARGRSRARAALKLNAANRCCEPRRIQPSRWS